MDSYGSAAPKLSNAIAIGSFTYYTKTPIHLIKSVWGLFYPAFNCSLILSLIMAINSEFVGLPLLF